MKLLLVGSRNFKVGDRILTWRESSKDSWSKFNHLVSKVDETEWWIESSNWPYKHYPYDNYEFEIERESEADVELEVFFDELQVGDELLDVLSVRDNAWIGCIQKTVIAIENGRNRYSTGGWDSRNRKYKAKIRRHEATPVKTGRWNGTCRCGKGTYTGFVQIEHDGPCSLQKNGY